MNASRMGKNRRNKLMIVSIDLYYTKQGPSLISSRKKKKYFQEIPNVYTKRTKKIVETLYISMEVE